MRRLSSASGAMKPANAWHRRAAAAILVLIACAFALVPSGLSASGTVADRVFGQGFTTNTVNLGGLSASSLNVSTGLAIDSAGRLYVADQSNNRVLEYDSPLTSQTANRVFGQGGSFTTNTANNGGISANSLNVPVGVALDGAGRLYISDLGNNRVLEYDSPLTSQTANRVFGQGGSFTSNTANLGGISENSLKGPARAALDGAGRLYIPDADNNRVLEYDTPLTSQTANRVFGQGGSFTSNTANNGGISASSLSTPAGVGMDSSGRLYVADRFNNRVLEYDTPLTSQTANRVFGQGGSFTTNTVNNGGISASSLNSSATVGVDSSGRLYIVDFLNNRVLEYDSPLTSQTANRVFGQGGSFTTNTANNGGISASSLNDPVGIAWDSTGRLYLGDAINNRVLAFDVPLTSQTASNVFGQGAFTTNPANSGGISAGTLNLAGDVAVDSAGRLYVADQNNNRVLEYDSPLTSRTPNRVFGQLGSFTTNTANKGGLSANSLNIPIGVAVDSAGRLYISD